jgi:hypothetical protein
MRTALPLIALVCATGAAADAPRTPSPEVRAPAASLSAEQRVCRDRIEQVRAASGLPRLDRDNATPEDQPLLIAAVDKRIGGCSVMVMYHDMSDIRPIPRAQDSGRLRRIR